jgi:membrane associated rhomboid family serine protease
MLPLRDTVKSRTYPYVVVTLIAVNAAAFLYQLSLDPSEMMAFLRVFGVVPARYTDPQWAAEASFPEMSYLPFLTSMFLHGGFLHVILNMWILWIFGDNVEDAMGHFKFLAFYLLTGAISIAAHIAFHASSMIPTVGASGAIAGVMGAYLLLYPKARMLAVVPVFFWPFFFEVRAYVFLLIWFGLQLVSAAMQAISPSEAAGIAFWAHVGGFGAGMVLHRMFLTRRFRRRRLIERNREF